MSQAWIKINALTAQKSGSMNIRGSYLHIYKCHYAILFFVASAATDANEIVDGSKEGSIVLRAAGHERVYENITTTEQYVNRSLSIINGSPAVLVLGRDTQYFTLAVERDQIVIDCAYSETRNNYNGARVTIATCGLNLQLDETYSDAARKKTENIQQMIYSFDTQLIANNSGPASFLLGKINDIEIYDRYPSVSALENAMPEKYIKGPFGCFNLGNTSGFLVFSSRGSPEIDYLDILQSEEPLRFQRMHFRDLKKLAVKPCS
ncbi:hypothetical protein ABQX22_20765 [Xanthomonas sp. WHRI 1810A]|uniref:hypothetical protein n=1 Tax=Xanthomonas sp. WHRI 1810A TaxID=3161565 RepID=UPI0032E901A8